MYDTFTRVFWFGFKYLYLKHSFLHRVQLVSVPTLVSSATLYHGNIRHVINTILPSSQEVTSPSNNNMYRLGELFPV